MQAQAISVSSTEVVLDSAPINRDWVIEGSPEARNRVIFKSRDGTAWTMIWDCTAGVFSWSYDCDETVHIIDGQVLLRMGSETRVLRSGDAVFFPAGSRAVWEVDTYVRKIAFLRQNLPPTFGILIKILKRATAIGSKFKRSPAFHAEASLGHSAQS